jgi:hypothetical protein
MILIFDLHHQMGLHVTHCPNVPYIYAELLFQKASINEKVIDRTQPSCYVYIMIYDIEV